MLSDVIKTREQSEEARAKTLYWLRDHLQRLGADSQVRVVRELIGDLRKSLREYEQMKSRQVIALQQLKEPPRAIEHKKR